MGFKAFNLLMVLLFVIAASVQFNDPDPLIWISVYLLSAVFCAAHALGKLPARWPVLFALVTGGWALTLVPAFFGQVSAAEVFGTVRMQSEEAEIAREFGGLMIVSAWMGALGVRSRRLARTS